MSAPEETINKCFERIEKAGIRFDKPKSELSKETQEEIKQMADGSYSIEPKWKRDFNSYIETLKELRIKLSQRFAAHDKKFERFIPAENTNLSWNILKDKQYVYVQDVENGIPLFAQVSDIKPFSSKTEYHKLANEIKEQWLEQPSADTKILPAYKSQTFYQDAQYFTLRTEDGKLQALANIELQNDGIMWGRNLNTAPLNQGPHGKIKGCGKAIIARMVSFCLETGNNILKIATDNPENIRYLKSLGMKEDGIRNIDGNINTVLSFDKEGMKLFLDKYQVNLSF